MTAHATPLRIDVFSDYNLALGLSLYAALAVCGARLLGDVTRVIVDPRLRGHQ